MNFLAILSLLLITSRSVLCRHITRQGATEDVAREEEFDMSKIRDEMVQNTGKNLELESIDATTPEAEILQENAAVPARAADFEPAGSPSFYDQDKLDTPMSKQRIQRMMKKAIVQIITGDLSTSDMLLLKSLNYDAEQVRKIREQELEKKRNNPESILEKKYHKSRADVGHEKLKIERDSKDISAESLAVPKSTYDYDDFNKQATVDYEYAASNFESTNSSWEDSLSENDDRSTELLLGNGKSLKAKIVFTINYNDSEFDSSSEENSRLTNEENLQSAINGTGNNFPAAVTSANSTPAPVDDQIYTFSEYLNFRRNYFSTTTENTIEEDNEIDSQNIPLRKQNEDFEVLVNTTEPPAEGNENFQEPFNGRENRSDVSPSPFPTTEVPDVTTNLNSGENRTTKYKGLRWVQDNVYQVIPEYIDALQTDIENETSESSDDDASYQNLDEAIIKNPTITEDLGPVEGVINDAPDSAQLSRSNANVPVEDSPNPTAHQQLAAVERRAQKQRTENGIKAIVLKATGRFNSSSNSNPLQPRPEILDMYSPTCGIPRNTDAELWQDPYAMNLQFQLNLTSDQHLDVAKLRLFRLPQENSTTATSTTVDDVEDGEKKIRISVYYYTKSLKKHRTPKKRLMDSKVAFLTTTGEHYPLDVKDAVRHWRSNPRNTNHGLLVLVEDQEGRPLQPSHYIQAPNCQNPTDTDPQDEKAYQRVPAIFIRACTRYVRLVGKTRVTSEFCGTEPERVSIREETEEH